MVAVQVEPIPEDSQQEPTLSWESFYQNYRKPGYVPGYEIVHKLGGGVFGVVFKARKESIGKAYAIKFLKVDDPGVKEQVLRELDQVSLFAQVDHPNLVSIEDKGVVHGIPYIIMGYAGDETLKSRLEEGPLSEEEALRILVQIVRGVHALHEHSLIHFDLKPANIFLKGDIARVGDYGLSKLITESRLSLSFGRGTPYYMAPEMLRRRGDHRSDIYSLGVILFECLSGEVPFQGDNEWEVLKGHEERKVVYPDSIPIEYRKVLDRMLAKDPDDRYQDLSELLQDLRKPGRLGESILLEYGAQRGQVPSTKAEAASARKPPVPKNAVPATASVPAPVVAAVAEPAGFELGPIGLLGGLIRALVIALLLPAKVLGLGMARGLQALLRWPLALLGMLGKLSVFVLVAVVIVLVVVILATLLGA